MYPLQVLLTSITVLNVSIIVFYISARDVMTEQQKQEQPFWGVWDDEVFATVAE